jgi:hypothetical protein
VSDESLFREVDEELRQEQVKKLWDRYGTVIIAACVAVILAVAGIKGWQYWRLKQSEAAGVTYFEAVKLLDQGKTAEAEKLLGGLSHPGYATIARFHDAAALAAAGKKDDAVSAYDTLAADNAIPASLRNVARLRAGYLLVDTMRPEQLTTRLGDLDQTSNPWRHNAREIIALSAYRARDYALADRYINTMLSDVESPPGVQQRAQLLAQLLQPLIQKPKT